MDDILLRQNVLDELDFRPDVDASHIGVSAENGVVTLSGHVGTYAEKIAAEEATKALTGVLAVADDVEVRLAGDPSTHDDQVAQRALDSIAWSTTIPGGAVKVMVENGWVTLSGEVSWQYQKSSAEDVVRNLYGVSGVTNAITLKSQPQPVDVRERIKRALERSADVDSAAITLLISDGAVTLEGTVDSWTARDRAEAAVWSAPGVRTVVDNLAVK
ncbi:MAG: BON domain-containing protein [Gammaproteobacteria bacterium]|nr:BON domain-containing protein [Gammaproteobacteria bacterium]